MKNLIAYFVLSFFIPIAINAQGLNNEYKIDQTDLLHISELQGISLFKFPLKFKQKTFLNVVIYEYKNGQLLDTTNLYEAAKGIVKQFGSTDYILQSNKGSTFFRCYFKEASDKLIFRFNLEDFTQEYEFKFEDIAASGSRAFDVSTIPLTKRTRLLAYYGVKDNSKPMHCALNDSNEELAKRMDHVIIIYLEPLDIKP